MHLPMYPGRNCSRLLESHQTFEVAAAQTSGLVNLLLSRQTGIFECKHPFIDKPMVMTEPTVASAWLLGLGLKLPSISLLNMPRMLNKDLNSIHAESFLSTVKPRI